MTEMENRIPEVESVPELVVQSIVEPDPVEEPVTEQVEEPAEVETVTVEKHTLTAQEEQPEKEISIEENEDSKRNLLIGAAGGAAIAVLLMTIGFGRTLFLGLMGCAGAFIYGVKDKQQWLKDTVNRLFPPRG